MNAMNFEWILHPAVPYLLLACSLPLSLYLFLSMKKEIRALALRLERNRDEGQAEMRKLSGALEELKKKELETEEKALMLRPRAGVNLSKRSQALRMHRRGETPESIAAALSIPQREVDLVLKINTLAQEN